MTYKKLVQKTNLKKELLKTENIRHIPVNKKWIKEITKTCNINE